MFDPYVDGGVLKESLEKAVKNSHVEKAWIYPGMFEMKEAKGFEIKENVNELFNAVISELEIPQEG